MAKNFEGKAVIVTGSSKGIGETIAVLFAQRGANVTVCGRDPERVDAVLGLCRVASIGGKNRFISVCGDITDEAVQSEIINKTVEQFGRLDVLVANHGILIPSSDATTVTSDDFDKIINVNVKATFFLIKKAIPHLENTHGTIITISSTGSSVIFPTTMIYGMTKAALVHLTRFLAMELAPKGIRVNTVRPGPTNTSMMATVMNEEGLANLSKVHPLNGRMASTDDVAKVVIFLASEASSFVTGESITVDGGHNLLKIPS